MKFFEEIKAKRIKKSIDAKVNAKLVDRIKEKYTLNSTHVILDTNLVVDGIFLYNDENRLGRPDQVSFIYTNDVSEIIRTFLTIEFLDTLS
jgi:hypothetical protein